jgi:hypothetical protein
MRANTVLDVVGIAAPCVEYAMLLGVASVTNRVMLDTCMLASAAGHFYWQSSSATRSAYQLSVM